MRLLFQQLITPETHLGLVLWKHLQDKGLIDTIPDLEKDPNAGMLVHAACAGGAFALAHAFEGNKIKKGDEVALVGFGGGLQIIGMVVKFG